MKTSIITATTYHCSRLAMALILLAGILGFLPAGTVQADGNIIFVDANATGTNTGVSWADAYTDLQDALGAAGTGDQVWVAAGTYYPTAASDPDATFWLENGVAVYGGFAGTESSVAERNPKANITILSGDIGTLLDMDDNSYHVVTVDGKDHTAVLDGFTITAGNAVHDSGEPSGGGIHIEFGSPTLSNLVVMGNTADFGGGIYNYSASPTLTNIVFKNNFAMRGAGMYVTVDSDLELTNATFENNTASWRGGGMTTIDSSPTLKNVTFTGNSAVSGGGLHSAYEGIPTLINVTITGNTASLSGGGIYNEESSPAITNAILYNNTGGEIYNYKSAPVVTYSIVKGGYSGTGNLDADPLLGPLLDHGGFITTMAPASGGPAIDAGLDGVCPDLDPRGLTRPQGAHCDLGAYEVDNAAPVITLDSHPSSLTASRSADFTFSVNDHGGSGVETVECRLEGSGYSPCTSPQNYGSLGDGGHTFQVQATDQNGNAGSVSYVWVVDATAPETSIDAHPADPETDYTPTFSFSGSDGTGSGIGSFVCQVDGGAAGPCISPYTLGTLLPGPHTFRVYAIDNVSNADLSPASYSWTVQQIPTRVLSIVQTGSSPTSASSVAFTVKFSEAVTGVAPADFSLFTSGVSAAYVKSVTGSGDTYTVNVTSGLRNGTIRLDIPSSAVIVDTSGNPLTGLPYTGGETYTILRNPTFVDVPFTHPYYEDIEILYANQYTAGCGTNPLRYCPDQIMDRAQAAVFMVRGAFGGGYLPNPSAYLFKDNWSRVLYARSWAEAMRETNLTTGCKASPLLYCPLDQLNREQAVIFGLKMRYGTYYLPPPATGTVFADMTDPNYWAAPWVEQAYKDGLITACGTASNGKPKFCPKTLVTRGLGAYIIVRAKNLVMP